MKYILFCLLCMYIPGTISCAYNVHQQEFNNFKSIFPDIKFPIETNDSAAFEEWNVTNFIDTNYITKYGLITKYIDKNYPLKARLEYKCSSFCRYETNSLAMLLYKIFTSEAGRGNPIIVLVTFSKDGIKKDEKVVLWNDAEDPLYSQKIILKIPNDSDVEIKSTIQINGYLEGKVVPKKTIEKTTKYIIQKSGKIKLRGENNKEVFIDNNPKILDDFPK